MEEAGYSVLFQKWDMVPGSDWLHEMDEAMKSADHTIAVLSDAYLTRSPFGQAEWRAAFRTDPSGQAGRLIPIRIEDCRPKGLLAGIVHADLFRFGDEEARKGALLEAVRAALSKRNKPLAEPAFPEARSALPSPGESVRPARVRRRGPRRRRAIAAAAGIAVVVGGTSLVLTVSSKPSNFTFEAGPTSRLLVLHGPGKEKCVFPNVTGNVIQRGCPVGSGDQWTFQIAVHTGLADPVLRLVIPGENRCLTMPPAGAAEGARALRVEVCRKPADLSQVWRLFVTARTDGFVYGNLHSQVDGSLCANINGAQTGDNAALVVWTCGESNPPNQQLRLEDDTGRI